MKKFLIGILTVFFVPLAFSGCALTTVEGNGERIEKVFEGSFTNLTVGTLNTVNVLPVKMISGDTPRVTICGDANLINNEFKFKSGGGALKISGSSLKRYKSDLLSITIESPVDKLALGGNVQVEIEALSSAADISLSGSAKGVIDASCRQLGLKMSGSSSLRLCGDYNRIEVNASGSSDLDVNVTADAFKVDASGSFEITGAGAVAQAAFKSSGSAEFRPFALVANDVSISSSGAASYEICAEKSLLIKGSGSTEIIYKGAAVPEYKLSGSGKVTKYGD